MKRGTATLITLLLLAAPPATRAAEPHLGEVSFANSGRPAAQEPFLRGLALLHDFEYGDAADAFRAAEQADPGFVMAYWGEAMTHNHPVWMQQNAPAARAALARLAATPQARAARAATPREAAYLHAAETLFGAGSKEYRDDRYAAEMETLHQRFPDDVDATAFYALALLGTAHHGRDFATYMRAAAALEEVFPNHPNHPGVLHYMIHSYDDPIHAPLGMRAARRYGVIAAGAPHALHMTSHIFFALGMWDEVIASNQAAMRAVNAPLLAHGMPPSSCFHYDEWLHYGYLQKHRQQDADGVLSRCKTRAEGALAHHPQSAWPDRSAVTSYAEMLVRSAIEAGTWPPNATPKMDDGAFLETRFDLAYGAAITAGNDATRLHQQATTLRTLLAALKAKPPTDDPGADAQQLAIWSVMAAQINALEELAAGHTNDAINTLRQAARDETAMPLEFGPPDVPKPTEELLGDVLLHAGQPAQAAEAYQAALARAPGRALSLAGLQAATGRK